MNLAALPTFVVSKSQYALLKNVSRGRVSQWISEGKIEPDALVGDGRSAKIDVRRADAHLRRKLDIGQRFGNGLSTRLNVIEPPATADLGVLNENTQPSAAPLTPVEPIEEKILREKLEGFQRENRKRAEGEAARAGRYVDSQAVGAQMAKISMQMLSVFEGSLSELAAALASKFEVPQRDVLHTLRTEFRALRARAATSMKESALALPLTIEDEIEPLVRLAAARDGAA